MHACTFVYHKSVLTKTKKKKSEIHSGVLPDMKKPINVYVILVVKLIYIYI